LTDQVNVGYGLLYTVPYKYMCYINVLYVVSFIFSNMISPALCTFNGMSRIVWHILKSSQLYRHIKQNSTDNIASCVLDISVDTASSKALMETSHCQSLSLSRCQASMMTSRKKSLCRGHFRSVCVILSNWTRCHWLLCPPTILGPTFYQFSTTL